MQRLIYISGLFLVAFLGSCSQQKVGNENTIEPIAHANSEPISKGDLTGEWTCYKKSLDYNVEETMLAPDADFLWLPGNGNLIFKEDSIWFFDYPREYHHSHTFKLEFNQLLVSNDKGQSWKSSQLELNGDSLVRITGGPHEIIRTEYYVRDTFEPSIIQLLLKDSVNTNELIGRWYLETIHQSMDSDPYDIEFPFDLPDSLIFTQENLPSKKIVGRRIILQIEGQPKEFRFGFTKEEGYSSLNIWFLPTNWYKGQEPLHIQYH